MKASIHKSPDEAVNVLPQEIDSSMDTESNEARVAKAVTQFGVSRDAVYRHLGIRHLRANIRACRRAETCPAVSAVLNCD